jgi:hypothetical protein
MEEVEGMPGPRVMALVPARGRSKDLPHKDVLPIAGKLLIPCLARLKELIQQGTIGSLLGVRLEVGEFLPGWHTY